MRYLSPICSVSDFLNSTNMLTLCWEWCDATTWLCDCDVISSLFRVLFYCFRYCCCRCCFCSRYPLLSLGAICRIIFVRYNSHTSNINWFEASGEITGQSASRIFHKNLRFTCWESMRVLESHPEHVFFFFFSAPVQLYFSLQSRPRLLCSLFKRSGHSIMKAEDIGA